MMWPQKLGLLTDRDHAWEYLQPTSRITGSPNPPAQMTTFNFGPFLAYLLLVLICAIMKEWLQSNGSRRTISSGSWAHCWRNLTTMVVCVADALKNAFQNECGRVNQTEFSPGGQVDLLNLAAARACFFTVVKQHQIQPPRILRHSLASIRVCNNVHALIRTGMGT